jgi:hypothetical protein
MAEEERNRLEAKFTKVILLLTSWLVYCSMCAGLFI